MDELYRAVRIQECAEDSYRLLKQAIDMEICQIPITGVTPGHAQFVVETFELFTYVNTGTQSQR
jgi:hypothetical protein